MEEGDYDQLVLPNEHSPSDQNRKLKRLKRAIVSPKSPLFDSLLQDDNEFKNPESPSKSLDPTNSADEVIGSENVSAVFEREKESEEFDALFPWEGERSGAKRALDFGDEGDSSDELRMNLDSENKGSEGVVEVKKGSKKRAKKSNGGDEEKKERRKKKKDDDKSAGADGKPKSSRRKVNQERKAEDAMLVDYQRQLRERRGVAFKSLPVVQKPVSSVLERIRLRKLQVSLKASGSISSQLSGPLSEIVIDSDSEEVVIVNNEDCKNESLSKGQVDPTVVKDDHSPSIVDGSEKDLSQRGDGQKSCQMPLAEDKEEPSNAFRQPTNDTQDLFSESQDDKSNAEMGSTQDEDLAPSLPSMNLKLDSAPFDDISSEEEAEDDEEEEENDKENINPLTGQLFRANLSPRGDPVRDFFDEEALEEDCSDDERRRFDDEVEDGSDAEEIAEMIATNYSEKPVDRERRNELHQMWLAQQDEAGTENLLQRLKCKAKPKDPTLLDEEDEEQNIDEMDDEPGDEENIPSKGTRPSIKQIKQMIPHMFTDKEDDGYVSSDDEETERRLNKQRMLGKVEIKDHAMFASPAENEATREVFGRIKKLNLVTQTKKKAKTSSFFQNLVSKGSDSNSSKSSFLNRTSSIPVSKRRASNTVKAFIFGRDDSNSRSSISASEEASVDMMNQAEKSNPRKRTFSAKFSSQAKQSTQSRVEINHSTSLIDILKRSSAQTSNVAQDNSIVDHQAAFAAFKPFKRPLKVEARS